MKLVKYVLNIDGTIPSDILDGGYFPIKNNNNSPRDLTFLGYTNSNDIQEVFANKNEFANYLTVNNFKNIDPITKEVLPFIDLVNYFWDKQTI